MKWLLEHDNIGMKRIFQIEITDMECLNAKFHDFDYALFEECEHSDKTSDKLLALETIARRIEETT
jgi:hypothetical protein